MKEGPDRGRRVTFEHKKIETAEQREEAHNLDALKQQTDALERALEVNIAEAEVNRRFGGKYGLRLNDALRRSLAIGIVAVGLQPGEALSAESKAEQVLSSEQQQIVEKLTGIPFSELSPKFRVEMPIAPGPEGRYILHIGQTHADPHGGFYRALNANSGISAQKTLEPLIASSAAAISSNIVFLEGFSDEENAPFIKKRVAERRAEITEDLADKPYTIEKAVKIANSLSQATGTIALAYYGKDIDRVFDEIKEALPTLTPTTQEESQKLEFVKMLLELHKFQKISHLGAIDPYLEGATLKLYVEGKITAIYPAETMDNNQRAIEKMKVEDAARRALEDQERALKTALEQDARYQQLDAAFRSTLDTAPKGSDGTVAESARPLIAALFHERENYRDEYITSRTQSERMQLESAKQAFEHEGHMEREKTFLSRVDEYDMRTIQSGNTLENIVVVYGSAHDFSNALNQWNQGDSPHHPIHRGLIKISIKEK